jgi:hypothetical protein
MDTNKEAQRFQDHINHILTYWGYPPEKAISAKVIDKDNRLVEVLAPNEIITHLQEYTPVSIEEKFLRTIGTNDRFDNIESDIFYITDAKAIHTIGGFGLSCLAYALNDFFAKTKSETERKLKTMQTQAVKLGVQQGAVKVNAEKRRITINITADKTAEIMARSEQLYNSLHHPNTYSLKTVRVGMNQTGILTLTL